MNYNFDNKIDYKSKSINEELGKNCELARIVFKQSPFTHRTIITVTNIYTTIAYIGGLISFILTIGNLIMAKYNEISLLKTIANNCYTFVEEVIKKYVLSIKESYK